MQDVLIFMFYVIFTLLYGLINFYLFRTAATAFPSLSIFFATGVLLLVGSLYTAKFLESRGKLTESLPFAWIGLTWIGIAGIGLALTLVTDLTQLITGDLFDNRQQFVGIVVATAALTIWGTIEAKNFRIRKVILHSEKLQGIESPIRIVQITDLHLGDSSSLAYTKRVVANVNELKPDLIVSTGDLFDGYLELMAPFVDVLRELDAPLGKFAVSGNHEVHAGLEEALSLTELAGFKVLRNSNEVLSSKLIVAGVEDPNSPQKPDEQSALRTLSSFPFILLLKHRPDFDAESSGKFDLQLSGHTHGGQIAPFALFTKLMYRAKIGLSEPAQKQFMYLSRGTGAWGPQIRLLAPPEISVFELTPE